LNKSRNIILLVVISIMGLWATSEFRIRAGSLILLGGAPDVIVGDMPSVARWGSMNGLTSYSVATTSCNIGDAQLDWISSNNRHPVISQNVYRVKDGRIEQLGQSWLKHGFFALSQSLCGTCQPTNGSTLGIGCSDPYSASLNGSQSGLGPKSEVNATTGFFPYPFTPLSQPRSLLDGRIRVLNSDLDPAQNVGARYFISSQYIQYQDAAAGNDDNNESYREVLVSGSQYDLAPIGSTQRQKPAILAWPVVHPDVKLFYVDIPDDGRVIVGIRTTELPSGGFHTDVAIENLNSHRSINSLGVTFVSGSTSNPGFHDVDYDQEPFSGADWTETTNGSEIQWSAETFDANENANALRWGTTYTYWCDSDSRPLQLTLGVFRPGTPTEILIDVAEVISADSVLVTHGADVSGDVGELAQSDDADLSIQRSLSDVQSRTEFVVKSFSPVANPAWMEVTLEGSVFARSSITQTIELFDYVAGGWELVDSGVAAQSTDSTVTVALTGNLSRFVQPGTMCVEARIHFQSDAARQQFSSNTDQFIWTIGL
jgi:hypothetical protein